MVKEVGGELLEVRVMRESEYTKLAGREALNGSQWEYTSAEGCSYISTTGVLGNVSVATSDASATVARNRTCALTAQVISQDKKLQKRIQTCRAIIESGKMRAAEDAKRVAAVARDLQ